MGSSEFTWLGMQGILVAGLCPCREGTMRGAFQLAELNLEAGKKGPCRLFEAEVAPFKLKPPGS